MTLKDTADTEDPKTPKSLDEMIGHFPHIQKTSTNISKLVSGKQG